MAQKVTAHLVDSQFPESAYPILYVGNESTVRLNAAFTVKADGHGSNPNRTPSEHPIQSNH